MGLTSWLRRHAAISPLVVCVPGGTAARLAVERAIRLHGWQPAESPAAANLLVVAGVADPRFETYLTRIQDTMPAPWTRVDITESVDAAAALTAAALRVGSTGPSLGTDSAARRPAPNGHDHMAHAEPTATATHAEHRTHAADPDHHSAHEGPGSHGGHVGHGDHDEHAAHGGRLDHDGHEGHGGHGMGNLPGGLAMAERADDRDGLRLDVLTVPLGPMLIGWPAGLVVESRMQGDVVSGATVSVVSAEWVGESFWLRPWVRARHGEMVAAGSDAGWSVAWRLDTAATLLEVAGWGDEATGARRMRDELLGGELGGVVDARLTAWRRRVGGSRLLRWSLRGIGRIEPGADVPPDLAGDVHDRLLAMVGGIPAGMSAESGSLSGGFVSGGSVSDETGGAIRSGASECRLSAVEFIAAQVRRQRWIMAALPELVCGAELAEARLIVASVGFDAEILLGASVPVGGDA